MYSDGNIAQWKDCSHFSSLIRIQLSFDLLLFLTNYQERKCHQNTQPYKGRKLPFISNSLPPLKKRETDEATEKEKEVFR